MRIRTDLKLPREHGAWAMLYVPFMIGALAGSGSSVTMVPLLLLLLSVTFIFVARESMLEWWRARGRGKPSRPASIRLLIYLGFGGLFGAPLLVIYNRLWLAPLAVLIGLLFAFNTWKAVRGEDRTVIGETVAILGLTLAAPAAYYVTGGTWDMRAWLLWMLCSFYFASSVFYVKLRVHSLNRRREELRRQSWRRCATYHLFLTAALLLLAATGSLDLFVLVAFTPVLARTFWQLARPSGQVSLKRVGLLEVVYSVIFLVLVAISFRAG
ncbi:MAG: YwiC-like family protein [Blastocatellia bacterium]